MYETTMTVVGTLITAVGRRTLDDGTTVATFRVASNQRRLDRDTGTWTDGDSLYVTVKAWRRLADNVHSSFTVGDPIVVRGRLSSSNYEKDGRRLTAYELQATAVGPDLARSTAVITRSRRTEPAAAPEHGERTVGDDPWAAGTGTGGAGAPEPGPDPIGATRPGAHEPVEAAVGA